MLTVYGIKNCDTCRKTMAWLANHGYEHRFHDLREDGIDVQTLERWCTISSWEALLNKRSLTWRKIPEIDRQNLQRSSAVMLMLEHPTVIKRPIMQMPGKLMIGFHPERYLEVFGAPSAPAASLHAPG